MKKWLIAYALLIVLVFVGYIVITKRHNKTYFSNGIINTKENVKIKKMQFNPGTMTIKQGEIVTWMNRDSVEHSIQSDTFRSINIQPGENFQYKFEKKGTFDYHCGIHPEMKGTIIVE